jgi:hypothetical protein
LEACRHTAGVRLKAVLPCQIKQTRIGLLHRYGEAFFPWNTGLSISAHCLAVTLILLPLPPGKRNLQRDQRKIRAGQEIIEH